MQALIYWLVYPILLLISKLPFWLFYKVSDFICFIVYRIVGYRKQTVRDNLNLAFPEMASKQKRIIEKRFYSHMVDMFLEMVKSISISKEELSKRFVFTNLELLSEFEQKNKTTLMIMGHYASYEWLAALQFYFKPKGYGIYKRVKNKYFDNLVHKIRERWNSELIANKEAIFTITKKARNNEVTTYAFMADQSPRINNANYSHAFFGHTVPWYTGVERLAKRLDFPVVHVNIKKLKRGHYEATFKLLSDAPRNMPDYAITDAFIHELEAQIKEAPEYYLWSHKRFKHKID